MTFVVKACRSRESDICGFFLRFHDDLFITGGLYSFLFFFFLGGEGGIQ